MLKNGWQRTGHHQSMAFLSLILQLRLLMGVAAMNLSVWHPIARGKGPGHNWYSDISIKLTGTQQATCISMPKPAGVQRLLVKRWKQKMNLPTLSKGWVGA